MASLFGDCPSEVLAAGLQVTDAIDLLTQHVSQGIVCSGTDGGEGDSSHGMCGVDCRLIMRNADEAEWECVLRSECVEVDGTMEFWLTVPLLPNSSTLCTRHL